MTGHTTDHAIISFIIFQLPLLLDVSSDGRIAFEIMAFVGRKKTPKPSGRLKRKLYVFNW